MPIFNTVTPDLKEIFTVCLKEDVPIEKVVKAKPVRITTAGTFIVDQRKIDLKHPYDLEADDVAGTYIKKEQTRFYEVFYAFFYLFHTSLMLNISYYFHVALRS